MRSFDRKFDRKFREQLAVVGKLTVIEPLA